jgi:alpha-galactosidase
MNKSLWYAISLLALSGQQMVWAAELSAVAPPPADSPVIRISTARSALTLFAAGDGRLYQLGFGPATLDLAAPAAVPPREDECYPASGNGFILEPAVQAFHSDGSTSTDLIYVKHSTESAGPDVTLTRIELKDRYYPFFVTLCFKAYREEDVIEQWTEIRHEENGPVTLFRFSSSAPVLPRKAGYWLTQFHGRWAAEANIVEERLTPGLKVLDSKIGVRAHEFRTPMFFLSLDQAAREETGEVVGGTLAWSGSFQFAFELDTDNRLRALCGINPFGSQYQLPRGQVFATPAMIWTWSNEGKGQASRNFHRWARRYGIRDGAQPRPVLLNNWEATVFNFDEARLVSLLDGAKSIGAELFLLDDGWFGNRHPRNDDRTGLGDWQVNRQKLPRGLSYLADEAKKRGVRFGIWLEPEMLNPVSDLFEAHPDWVIQQPHRELQTADFRNQAILDLTRPAVREFVWGVVDGTFRESPGISYVKWDANRIVSQPGSTWLTPQTQSHLAIDYTWALYDVMARMARQHPGVMGMACSSGGGRVDYGVLRFFDSFWASDNTDPRARVIIQWGYSHVFPASTISAHVTRSGERPLKFAIDVAMSGAFGVDMDLDRMSAEDRQFLAATIGRYKEHLREIVQQGDLFRLESPYDQPRAALNFVSADRSQAVLFVYQLKDSAAKAVKPQGLDPAKHYQVREVNLPRGAASRLAVDGTVMDGATLMRDGLVPPCAKEFDSTVIELNLSP